ncbi:hypothetical protein ACLOJK_030891 [Asimina triloba]
MQRYSPMHKPEPDLPGLNPARFANRAGFGSSHHNRLHSPLHLVATPTLLNLAAPCNSGLPLVVSSPLSLPFSSSSSHSSSVVPATSIVVAAPLQLQSALARCPSISPRCPPSPLLTLPIYHSCNIHHHHHSPLPLWLSLVVVVAVAVVLRLATQNVRDYGFAGSIIVTDESMEEEGFALNLKTSRQFARTQVRFLLADIASVPGYRFVQWLELVRKRTSQYRSSGFPNHPLRQPTMPLRSISCSQERYRRIPWRLSASMSASDFNIRFGSASVTNISIR